MDAVQHQPNVGLAAVHHAEELFSFNLTESRRHLREEREKSSTCNHSRLIRKFCSCQQRERNIEKYAEQVMAYRRALDCLKKGNYQPAIDILRQEGGSLKESPDERQRLESRKPAQKHRIDTISPYMVDRVSDLERELKKLEAAGEQ